MNRLNVRMAKFIEAVRIQRRIVWALLLRELATRYGRDNIGFLWIVGEPLLFCFGVIIMWSLIRPPYQNGIGIVPFTVTGYLPLTLLRHVLSQAIPCLRVNSNLLYHRQISVLKLFVCRCLLEIMGITAAFFVVASAMWVLGLMEPPKAVGLVYLGWFLLAWIAFGLALIFGCLSQFSDIMERAMSLLTYAMIPMTGTFYMIAWLPYQYRAGVEKIPLVNCVEMIRRGFFGEFTPTYFNVGYTAAWALSLTFVGLLLTRLVRPRIEIE